MIRRRYACPECTRQFVYDHHPSIESDPVPRFCQFCGFDSAGEFETPPVAPAIARGMVQRTDNLLRSVDEGADFRANLAREQLGLDSEAAAAIRDTSAAPVNNAVSQHMASLPANSVGFNPANGLGYSAAVANGPYPNAGARAMQGVRAFHQNFTAGAGHNPTATTSSETPALETQQPGYKRRA